MLAKMENRALLDKIFHPEELRPLKGDHLAGIFAAKEAFFKALGINPEFLEIIIRKNENGQPSIIASNEVLQKYEINEIKVSIAHDVDYAVANVIIL